MPSDAPASATRGGAGEHTPGAQPSTAASLGGCMDKTCTPPGPVGPGELFSVVGKTVVVTGGATGIGRMIAGGFVAGGARVVLVSRRAGACEQAAAELREFGLCEAVVGDLATAEGADLVAERVLAVAPVVDVLVNNAGATWVGPLEDHPPEAFDAVWAVNVRGLFRLTVGLLPGQRAAVVARSGDQYRVDRRWSGGLGGGELRVRRQQGGGAPAHPASGPGAGRGAGDGERGGSPRR
jgi:NAD(P)-dependent dehydrogenase (short-subunit alcohol dehydrogenase family)